MPVEKHVRGLRWKLAVLVLLGLAAPLVLIFAIPGHLGGLWGGRITLISYFENSAGVEAGAPVNLDGVRVGNVKALRIVPSHGSTPVEVVMSVDARRAMHIRTDCTARLKMVGVLGDMVVEIDSRHATGPPVRNGSVIPAMDVANLQDAMQQFQGTVEQLDVILPKVDVLAGSLNSQKGTVGLLLQHHLAIYNELTATSSKLADIVNGSTSGKGTLGRMMTDDRLRSNFSQTVKGLDRIEQQARSQTGARALFANVTETEKNMHELQATVHSGSGAMALADPKFQAKLSDAEAQAASLGTSWKSVRTGIPPLHRNLSQLQVSAHGLMTGIRKNPRKYLAIRMRIF